MNKRKFIAFAAGIPLLVLILIIIILVSETKPGGISRAAAYKSAALLLTDAESCEQLLKEQGQNYFSEKDRNNWYAKYLNYLYVNGYLSPDTTPSDPEYVQGYLTYREAEELAEALVPGQGEAAHVGKKKQGKTFPSDNWWFIYDSLRKELDQEGRIKEVDVLLYGTPMNIRSAPAWTAYTSEGKFRFEGISLDSYIDWELKVLVKDGEMIAVRETVSDSVTYKNVWLTRGEGETFSVHLGTIERTFPMEASLGQSEEFADNLADLSLKNGKLQKVTLKKKRITGKVLAVKDDSIEIEGYGKIKLDKDFKVYKLYGQFEEQSISDILVGYDIQEFVVAHGKLCAALTMREFDAKTIRVMIMNTNFQSVFHPSVTLSAESGLNIAYGEESVQIPAKAEVIIDPSDERLKDGRIVVTPVEAGDTISVNSIRRSLGTPTYSGSIEIRKETEGITLINELYLEDYLTRVVPSEMPDSYEMEALKAQAVCARTYAYRQIQSNTYSQYGAHVDDSTNYQVYNNKACDDKTTAAVKETYGKMLFYEDKAVEAFYFSTSCGHTTDGSVWGSEGAKLPYLQAVELRDRRKTLDLTDNSAFDAFIRDKDVPAYDSGFSMYRWETDIGSDVLSGQIAGVGKVQNLTVMKRGPGGIAQELLVEGSDGSTTVKTQGNIRNALGNASLVIKKKDGSTMEGSAMLPSAFISIEKRTGDDGAISFHIYGGGFGHGVGMSQNGAQGMAKDGKSYQEILKFFYKGAEVREQ